MMLQYAIFGSDPFTKSNGIFSNFYKEERRKSIAIKKCHFSSFTKTDMLLRCKNGQL